MLNYNHLYYFFVTARTGSVSHAAEYLHISQPSLSSQLKVLESSLNKKFFEKKGRKLQLTPEGERAFAYCRKIFETASEFEESLRTPLERQNQKLNIGVSDQVERPFIADVLSPLLKNKKAGTQKIFAVSAGQDEQLLRDLRSKNLDLLVCNRPIYADDIEELATISMPVNLLVSTDNLKQSKIHFPRTSTVRDYLQGAPWGLVLPSSKMKLRHETDLFFQEIKTRKKVVMESDVLSVVARAILDGAGMGFLPTAYVLEEIKAGLLKVLGPKSGYWKHNLYFVIRKEGRHEDLIEEVKRSLQQIDKTL